MFWAAIWKTGRTSIILMRRDSNSSQGGYTAQSYREALQEGLLPHYNGI